MTAFAPATMLADDWREGLFLGRIETAEGPTPVLLKDGILYDMSGVAATAAQLVADRAFDVSQGQALGDLESLNLGADGAPQLLSPVDLQCVKAAGVTFAVSAVERVIEERARGDAGKAAEVRAMLEGRIGGGIRGLKPGSPEAMVLKQALIDEGMWSQYLEVAIGPDAEIFTKSPVLSTVGWHAEIGVRSDSSWNNPEPEIAILADSHGEPVGASLGNDVNLRDFEGRSALLLGKAKDNNASCSLGPFVRLFDASFTMDDVRQAEALGYKLALLPGLLLMATIDACDAALAEVRRNHVAPTPQGGVAETFRRVGSDEWNALRQRFNAGARATKVA